MSNRPLLFVIMGCLQLLEPLIKILYFKATTHFSFETIFSNISSNRSPFGLFEFWLLFPLSGIALLGLKKWSYPLFTIMQAYLLWNHLTYQKFQWPYYSEVPHWPSMALLIFNLSIVGYFTFPEARRIVLETATNWWAKRTRYNITLPTSIHFGDATNPHQTMIHNISETGLFLAHGHQGIKKGAKIWINLSYAEFQITIRGKVVGIYNFGTIEGIGIKFRFENIFERITVKKIIKQISKVCTAQDETIKMEA